MGYGVRHEYGAHGEQAERGYGLLVAATPPGRHPAVDATEALPALAATPPSVLLGTQTGSVVQLADPGDPNTVLSHLRTAAAHDGPLLVYLAGQLMLDSREHLPHLALTRSTPRSVRYTGLPWHWLSVELGRRPPGLTAVIADLAADETMWQRRAQHHLANGLVLYGSLTAPRARRLTSAPEYSRALAAVLRVSRARPPLDELHQLTLHHAGFGFGDAERMLLATASSPAAPGAGYVPVAGPGTAPVPGAAPGPSAAPPGPAPATVTPLLPAPGAPTVPPRPSSPPPGPRAAPPAGQAAGGPRARPPVPADGKPADGQPAAPARPAAAPAPAPAGTEAPLPDMDTKVPADVPAGVHEAIYRAALEGRHGEAATMAAQWETAALRASGPHSSEAVHWVEVRADLAHRAGDAGRACTLWLQAASVRLQRGQATDAPEVFGAVDRAHHCWHQVTDPAQAYPLGVQLAELRELAPGHRPGAVRDVRERLASLTAAPGEQAAAG
ncbi:hypothetical protein [Streptomyces sp. WMMB 322]|uniref:hypothetical protein n=1 Tax=Streptomyces sp. WMMB 322 TaxID=1286821 RepID=UPI0006E1F7AF|nr:hypothetical protein [Streptomyces sp. WMMB 322]SCK58753.1 hypothetical protein H180DRAFT_05592 [Streptomyces sp. WMMB 322]